MSNKERAMRLLDELSEYKLGYVVAYLQGLITADDADEGADDEFCKQLYLEYETDPEKGEAVSLEEAAQSLGVVL